MIINENYNSAKQKYGIEMVDSLSKLGLPPQYLLSACRFYNENGIPPQRLIVFHPNETVKLEVRLENETVWLSVSQMSLLFDREESNIRRHILNIFKEKELEREGNVHNLHVPLSDKPVPFYSLEIQ